VYRAKGWALGDLKQIEQVRSLDDVLGTLVMCQCVLMCIRCARLCACFSVCGSARPTKRFKPSWIEKTAATCKAMWKCRR